MQPYWNAASPKCTPNLTLRSSPRARVGIVECTKTGRLHSLFTYDAGTMKRFLLLVVLVLSPTAARAEKEVYDLIHYRPPSAWKHTAWKKDESVKNVLSYTMTDQETRSYCQIFLIRSTTSKGDLNSDFNSEWHELVVKQYKTTAPANVTDTAEENGWKVKSGVATFEFDGGTSIAILTTISGYTRATSIVAVTSNQQFTPAIQELLGSVELKRPPVTAAVPAKPGAKETAKPAALQGYMDYSPFTKTWTWKVRYPPPPK